MAIQSGETPGLLRPFFQGHSSCTLCCSQPALCNFPPSRRPRYSHTASRGPGHIPRMILHSYSQGLSYLQGRNTPLHKGSAIHTGSLKDGSWSHKNTVCSILCNTQHTGHLSWIQEQKEWYSLKCTGHCHKFVLLYMPDLISAFAIFHSMAITSLVAFTHHRVLQMDYIGPASQALLHHWNLFCHRVH